MMQKYVIINGHPILFSSKITHADMIDITPIDLDDKVLNIESAGFFVIVNDKEKLNWDVVCMGESTSLAIHSKPEVDQQIIKEFLRLGDV